MATDDGLKLVSIHSSLRLVKGRSGLEAGIIYLFLPLNQLDSVVVEVSLVCMKDSLLKAVERNAPTDTPWSLKNYISTSSGDP